LGSTPLKEDFDIMTGLKGGKMFVKAYKWEIPDKYKSLTMEVRELYFQEFYYSCVVMSCSIAECVLRKIFFDNINTNIPVSSK